MARRAAEPLHVAQLGVGGDDLPFPVRRSGTQKRQR
jgi:hypothetical protein